MYILKKSCKRIENKETVLYGVADERCDYGDFSDNQLEAENFVNLLNSENVEPIHIHDIIEDMFY